ncbi:MAG: TetR/AcrR family transcriptional regulator [Chloroflexota bacterium]
MPRPRKRYANNSDLQTAIINTAWQQIGEYGATALSLRAIARELRITAPAIYNYYPSRDELVTALVIEAFSSFAAALEAGCESATADDHAGRYRALANAYRNWALGHPQHYMLIFGTPIPDYQFPPEVESTSIRSFVVLLNMIDSAYTAGALNVLPGYIHITPELTGYTRKLEARGLDYPPVVFYLAMETWSKIHGLVSLELYGHVPNFLGDAVEDFMAAQIEGHVRVLGLQSVMEKDTITPTNTQPDQD